jgi:4-oxalomesaconate tautomerase
MPELNLSDLVDFRPRLRGCTWEFPVHYMRGGTSTGLVLWERYAPSELKLREELLRHLMGAPLTGFHLGNKQITGLGRGLATSNKVFLANVEPNRMAQRISSTLAQLTGEHSEIDWSVNCGNMSAALPMWAFDVGILQPYPSGICEIDIRNTNTGVITTTRMTLDTEGRFSTTEIPGVNGLYPSVDLFLHNPVGAKTGKLLPTGAVINDVLGHRVSCIDVAVPMVIIDASQLGKTAHEPIAELEADQAFMERLRGIWVAAGLLMGLKRRDGQVMTAKELEHSETIPKVCIVGAPRSGGNLAVRYFTPQTGHASMAVSGGCCLAAAALIPGSVAHELAQRIAQPAQSFAEYEIDIENPAGILNATIDARMNGESLIVRSAAYRRNTQLLLRGHVPLYRASDALSQTLKESTA